MSTAFLFNGSNVLLMKKQFSRLSDTPFWSGLGGHLEPDELNAPLKACYRKIYEESGLLESDIVGLRLRYILLRNKDNEIRQQFVYFGETTTLDFTSSDEGELFWVNKDAMHELHMSRIIRFMLEHFHDNTDKKEIVIGVISIDENENPIIQWSDILDPKTF